MASHSRLVRLAGGHVGWIGLLEYLEPIVRGVVGAEGGPAAANVPRDGPLSLDRVALARVLRLLERRLGVVPDAAERIDLPSLEDLVFTFAQALARQAAAAGGTFPVRVRVTDGDGYVEYDDCLTPYFAQHLRDVIGRQERGRDVALSVPGAVGLWPWVALGRALRTCRRMNPPRERQNDMTAGARPAR